jgi:hypothetical protein
VWQVPKGEYVMRVSVFDKLGGTPFRWGKTYRPCATRPVAHAGRHFSVDMWLEQNVFTSTPAPVDLRPSMVFIFQLYRLASADCHVDTVVGWGALPVCNSRFEVNQGKFRVPLLRGNVDYYVTRFERFEQLYKVRCASVTSLGRVADRWAHRRIWTTGCATCTLRSTICHDTT